MPVELYGSTGEKFTEWRARRAWQGARSYERGVVNTYGRSGTLSALESAVPIRPGHDAGTPSSGVYCSFTIRS